jgi:hypothetical protein
MYDQDDTTTNVNTNWGHVACGGCHGTWGHQDPKSEDLQEDRALARDTIALGLSLTFGALGYVRGAAASFAGFLFGRSKGAIGPKPGVPSKGYIEYNECPGDPPYREDYDPSDDSNWVSDSGGSTDITDPDYDAAKDIAEDYTDGDMIGDLDECFPGDSGDPDDEKADAPGGEDGDVMTAD